MTICGILWSSLDSNPLGEARFSALAKLQQLCPHDLSIIFTVVLTHALKRASTQRARARSESGSSGLWVRVTFILRSSELQVFCVFGVYSYWGRVVDL